MPNEKMKEFLNDELFRKEEALKFSISQRGGIQDKAHVYIQYKTKILSKDVYKESILGLELQNKEQKENEQYLSQSIERLKKLQKEDQISAEVFTIKDKYKLGQFLEIFTLAAKSPSEMLFYKEMLEQVVIHSPEGTQLPLLKTEEKYMSAFNSKLALAKSVIPDMKKSTAIKKVEYEVYNDPHLSYAEKKILIKLCTNIQEDLKVHIQGVMSSDPLIDKENLNTNIKKHISEVEQPTNTTETKGWLNKIYNIVKSEPKPAVTLSSHFKERLEEIKEKAIKPDAIEELDTNIRPGQH